MKKANDSLFNSLKIFDRRRNIYICGLSVVLTIVMVNSSNSYDLFSQKMIQVIVLSIMVGMIFGLLGHRLRQYFFSDEAIVKKFAEEKWIHLSLYKFLVLFPIVAAISIGIRIVELLTLSI